MRGLLIGIVVAVALWSLVIIVLFALGRRHQARELATVIPNLLVLLRGLLRDRRVSRSAKLWLGFALVWIASPIDLVPEFIPVVGPLDDAIVAGLVLRRVLRRTAREVVIEHWRGDPAMLDAILRQGRSGRTKGEQGARAS
jgi:uncharacterized membrane protein YkvA (DUF1232 family)